MSSTEQYPARVEEFHGLQVTFYEIDGKEYISGEDVGCCLGLAEPGIAVNKIYRRNREELQIHQVETNLVYPSSAKDGRGGGRQQTRLFSETGANLLGMFSRSPKARDFRLWLARLPRRVRALVNGQAVAQAYAHGVEQGLRLLEELPTEVLAPEEIGQLIALRRLGFTQVEAAHSLGVSREHVQVVEKSLKERGLVLAPVRKGRKQREMRRVLVRELGRVKRQIPPSPPLLKGGEEAGHESPAS
jgi:prophage antirepressor-like protein